MQKINKLFGALPVSLAKTCFENKYLLINLEAL
jgi:hypothetical protein